MTKITITQDIIDAIINDYVNNNISIRKLSRKFKIWNITISKILKDNNIKLDKGKFTRTTLTKEDEFNIIDDYIVKKLGLTEISRKYHIENQRTRQILEKNGYKVRKAGYTIQFTEEELKRIFEIYNETKSIKWTADCLNVNETVIKRILKENNIEIEKIRTSISLRKLQIRYGEEIGTQRWADFRKRVSNATAGEKNFWYGKAPPAGTGYGIQGWYKGIHFRSLKEVSYMIHLDENNINWISAEKMNIKYIKPNQKKSSYHPDFLIDNEEIVEIKPAIFHDNLIVQLKKEAALKFCEERGLKYKIIDFNVDLIKIEKYLNQSLIKFQGHQQKRFLKNLDKHKKKLGL